jgi:glycosyltransferase involved in cell wall biosynthesis
VRIIYCNQVDLTELSGQGTHEKEISRHLLADESVDGFYVGQKPKQTDHEYENYPNVVFIPLSKNLAGFALYQFRLFNALRKLIRTEGAVIFLRYSPTMIAPLIIAILYRVPLVVRTGPTLRNLDVYEKKVNPVTRMIIKWLSSAHFYRANKVVVVTRIIADFICRTYKLPREKITISGNGCNPSIFRILGKLEIPLWLQAFEGRRLVTFLGSFHSDTGVDDLAEALILLCRKFPEVSAVLAGDGPLRRAVIDRIDSSGYQDRILVPGKITQEKACQFLNVSKLAVVPFNQEGLTETGSAAVKCYEYLATGVPVLATRHSDHEFLQEHNLGELCDSDDPVAMADAIEVMLAKREDSNSKTRRREYALQNGTWHAAYGRIKAICQNVVLSSDESEPS